MINQEKTNRDSLSTTHVMDDLGVRTAHGGLVLIAAQPVRFIIQFMTTAILARLLMPEDFGVVAMAVTVTSFITIFSNMGLSVATVQRDDISQDTVSALFWINVGVGLALVPLTCAVAPIAAWFFGDPRVATLIIAMSLNLPIAAAGAQHTAIMVRTMRFMALQWAGLVGHFLGAVAAVILAWRFNAHYWSLVGMSWVAGLSTLLLIWWMCRWRPSRVKEWSDAKSSIRFGMNVTGVSIIEFFHRQLDNILLGWRFGPSELGYYSRSYQLMMLPITVFNNSLSATVEPSLSRLQNDPRRWRAALLNALTLTTFLGSGLACALIAGAEPFVNIVYGPHWHQSIDIFRWLAISCFAGVPLSATGWIYISLGRTRQMLNWTMIFASVVAVAFLIALPYGAIGIAMAYALVLNIALLPGFAFASRNTPVSFMDLVTTTVPLAFAGGLAAWIGSLGGSSDFSDLLNLVLRSGAAGICFVCTSLLLMFRVPQYDVLRQRLLAITATSLGRLHERWR